MNLRMLALHTFGYSAYIVSDFHLDQDRKAIVAKRVGTWAFSAHEFTDDELLYGALVMLQHTLQMPELERWNMTEGRCCVYG